MALREIIHIPDNRLRETCAPVDGASDDVRALMDDMLETMYDAPGIGLAACQIGILKRVVVVDVAGKDEPADPLFLINPEIYAVSEELSVHEEGCLSIPDYYEDVTRPAECKVRFLDRNGEQQDLHCKDLLSTCVQHEVDHLNGKLFIDYLSRLKRDRVIKKFAKLDKRKADSAA